MTSDQNPFASFFDGSGLNAFLTSPKTIGGVRDMIAKSRDLLDVSPPPVERREDIVLPGGDGECRARVYIPFGADHPTGPGLVFFHGGGFVAGSVDGHEPVCQRLAAASGVRAVSIDYRLAPEAPFPAAVDDAFAVFDAIAGGALSEFGFDGDRLAVGGDSAGATLAAVLAQHRREAIAFQLLLYPLLQLADLKRPKTRWQEGPFLSTPLLEEIRKHYVGEADPRDPLISPLFAEDLKGVAPAYILTAEFDPLLDEGNAYADRLAADGVPVETRHYKGVPHGFLSASRIFPNCIPALEACARALAVGLS